VRSTVEGRSALEPASLITYSDNGMDRTKCMTNNRVGRQHCVGVVGGRASVKGGGLRSCMIVSHVYCIDHWSISGIGVVLSSGECVCTFSVCYLYLWYTGVVQ